MKTKASMRMAINFTKNKYQFRAQAKLVTTKTLNSIKNLMYSSQAISTRQAMKMTTSNQ